MPRRTFALVTGIALAGLLTPLGVADAAPVPHPSVTRTRVQAKAQPQAPLTNLNHLDFLTTEVTPPAQPGHTTYQSAARPDVGVLWVYANRQSDGGYQRTGGGSCDAADNTYGQGSWKRQ